MNVVRPFMNVARPLDNNLIPVLNTKYPFPHWIRLLKQQKELKILIFITYFILQEKSNTNNNNTNNKQSKQNKRIIKMKRVS